MSEAPPFAYTGVDFAGPLYIRGSERSKVWICLFTCCVVRAIHLEIVSELTAQAFIRCFKRFTARRGLPRKVISDNAKTFKLARKAILAMLNDPVVHQYFSDAHMEWCFNLEKAPWWGGFFERLIKSTKRCLKRTICQAKLSFNEMVVNSRPLSYVSTKDLEQPLTPSHLLIGHRLLSLPRVSAQEDVSDPEFVVSPSSATDLVRRLRHLNSLPTIDAFWHQNGR